MKRIVTLFLLSIPFFVEAKTNRNDFFPDSTVVQPVADSTSNSPAIPRNKYFALGSGGSYGTLGVKLGRFTLKHDRWLSSNYIIAGLGAFKVTSSFNQSSEYKLGIMASVGRRWYFPNIFFVEGRAGFQDYTIYSGRFLPVLGARLLVGAEFRSSRFGFSIGGGISQNLLFDYKTKPVVELGFIMGDLMKIKAKDTD